MLSSDAAVAMSGDVAPMQFSVMCPIQLERQRRGQPHLPGHDQTKQQDGVWFVEHQRGRRPPGMNQLQQHRCRTGVPVPEREAGDGLDHQRAHHA